MLQTVSSHKIYAGYEFQAYTQEPRYANASNSRQSYLSMKNASEGHEDDELTITPFDKESKLCTNLSSKSVQAGEADEAWPQIDAIVRRIRSLEARLKNQRRLTLQLTQRVQEYESSTLSAEEERKRAQDQATTFQENYSQLQVRVKELENALAEKETILLEKQQMIENIQFSQLKKNNEYQERIRKLNSESKDLMDKLRKARIELEKERSNNQQLRDSMASQLEHLQSQKESYLQEEVTRLKETIQASKEQREALLYAQIDQLNRKLYLQQQDIKRKDIELGLAERKKQQAVADTNEKKDQQIKVQKTLLKAVNDKMGKLQEQMRLFRSQSATDLLKNRPRILRISANRNNITNIQEQISFDLSPDKS